MKCREVMSAKFTGCKMESVPLERTKLHPQLDQSSVPHVLHQSINYIASSALLLWRLTYPTICLTPMNVILVMFIMNG